MKININACNNFLKQYNYLFTHKTRDFPIRSYLHKNIFDERAKFNWCIRKSSKEIRQISWVSDIHMDVVDEKIIAEMLQIVKQQDSQALIITGDIGISSILLRSIEEIQRKIQKDLFFVCGNHDFYGSSISKVRNGLKQLSFEKNQICYLHKAGIFELNAHTALIGDDGWADGNEGLFYGCLKMRDFFEIEDLSELSTNGIYSEEVKRKIASLAKAGSMYVESVLPFAFKYYQNVILATHVPPFRKASFHNEKICDDRAAPMFVNQILGKTLESIMQKYPKNHLTVLCGHTHTPTDYWASKNLRVLVAESRHLSIKLLSII